MSAARPQTLFGPRAGRQLLLLLAFAFAAASSSCATRQIQPVTETPPYSTTSPSYYPSK